MNRVIVSFIGGLASQMNNYAFMLAVKRQFPDLKFKALDGCFEHNRFELGSVFGLEFDWIDRRVAQRLVDFHIGKRDLFCRICNVGHKLRNVVTGPRKTQLSMHDLSGKDARRILESLSYDCVIWGNCTLETLLDVADDMRRQLKFAQPLTAENKACATQMETCNSVSIHLRRGDYAACGFKLLGGDYYRTAIAQIERSVKDPHYFIFSDDLPSARALFHGLPRATFVEGNRGKRSYVDMQLMSLCKHNVIANSGFSFMGAFLGDQRGKVVVAPCASDEKDVAAIKKLGWIQL